MEGIVPLERTHSILCPDWFELKKFGPQSMLVLGKNWGKTPFKRLPGKEIPSLPTFNHILFYTLTISYKNSIHYSECSMLLSLSHPDFILHLNYFISWLDFILTTSYWLFHTDIIVTLWLFHNLTQFYSLTICPQFHTDYISHSDFLILWTFHSLIISHSYYFITLWPDFTF